MLNESLRMLMFSAALLAGDQVFFLEPQASGVFGVKLSTLYLILFAAAQKVP